MFTTGISKSVLHGLSLMGKDNRMSLLFLILFVADVKCGTHALSADAIYAWALFSIADALWVRNLLGGK